MIEVCDLVKHSKTNDPQKWRVTSHYKKEYYQRFANPLTFAQEFIEDILEEEFKKEQKKRRQQRLPHKTKFRYIPCLPHEATHIGIVAVRSGIVPINDYVKIGIVPWPQNLIEDEKNRALKSINSFHVGGWEWE